MDQFDTMDRIRRIKSIPSVSSVGWGKQSFIFIETKRGCAHADFFGKLADGEFF